MPCEFRAIVMYELREQQQRERNREYLPHQHRSRALLRRNQFEFFDVLLVRLGILSPRSGGNEPTLASTCLALESRFARVISSRCVRITFSNVFFDFNAICRDRNLFAVEVV